MSALGNESFLTREEDACLKTALGFVVLRRRLLSQQQSSDTVEPQPLLPRILPDQEALLLPSGASGWAPHLSHILTWALQEAVLVLDKQQPSLRLDSLVTHLGCQLESWTAAIADNNDQEESSSQDWIRSNLLIGGTNDTAVHARFYIARLLIQNRTACTLMVPILIHLISTTTSHNDHQVGHWWNLLQVALETTDNVDLLQDAVHALMMMTTTSNESLAVQFWTNGYKGTNLLVEWAKADLVQRLLTRLACQQHEFDH